MSDDAAGPPPRPGNLEELSRVYGPQTWGVYELLDESLRPRGPESLLDTAARYLAPGAVVLDAGCRNGRDLIELVRRCGASGVGVDPVALHVEQARAAVAAAGLEDRIDLVHGVMHDLPYPEGHFDLVWCRDVLEQVDELDGALAETARVLEAGGRMVVFTVFATDRLEPAEAAMLDRHLGNVPANLVRGDVEAAFARAGLAQEVVHAIGTEWREHAEERTRPVSRALLRLARLRRRRDMVIDRFGADVYAHVEANLHWEAYQLLGKLEPVVYVLRRRERPSAH